MTLPQHIYLSAHGEFTLKFLWIVISLPRHCSYNADSIHMLANPQPHAFIHDAVQCSSVQYCNLPTQLKWKLGSMVENWMRLKYILLYVKLVNHKNCAALKKFNMTSVLVCFPGID